MKPLEMDNSEDVALFDFDDEQGRKCHAFIDMSYENFENKVAFPWLIWIELHYKDVDDASLPTAGEAEALTNAEKMILKKLVKTCNIHYVGRTTLPNMRELMIYVDQDEMAQIAIQRLQHEFKDRKVHFSIESDPHWNGVSGFFD